MMDKIKASVIGLGNIGLLYDYAPQRPHPSTHVFAYKDSSAFTLVCGIDGDPCRKEDFVKAAPDAVFFDSLDGAVASGVMDDVEVISICTPPSTHLSVLTQLLKAGVGKLFFCEKPIVSNVREVDRLRNIVSGHTDVTIIPNISRRWNTGLRKVSDKIADGDHGDLEKIHIRYTRGIYNTGSHLFDLLHMWTGHRIKKVHTLGKTSTSAFPEKSYSFYFVQDNGVTGYAEAMDDTHYYLFDIDLFLSSGKIEMRYSGDEVIYYGTCGHHLFDGFDELCEEQRDEHLLSDSCIKNAIDNIEDVVRGTGMPYCSVEDAVYPLYVAEAIERSYRTGHAEEVVQ